MLFAPFTNTASFAFTESFISLKDLSTQNFDGFTFLAEILIYSKYILRPGSHLCISEIKGNISFNFRKKSEISLMFSKQIHEKIKFTLENSYIYLTKLLPLAEFLKRMPSEALGTGIEAFLPTHDQNQLSKLAPLEE